MAQLIEAHQNLEQIHQSCWHELQRGVHQRKHPFRFTVLATYNGPQAPAQRSIVLRKVQSPNTLLFYTDARSQKVQQLQQQAQASVLFWHPARKVQITATGTITLHQQNALSQEHLPRVQQQPADYLGHLPPGSQLHAPEQAQQLEAQQHLAQNFTVLAMQLQAYEVLQLAHPRHIRARFTWPQGQEPGSTAPQGQFIMP